MRFEKWHGTGNHHIVVERDLLPWSMTPERASALCDPAFGIGAEGVLEISFEDATPRMTVWNADGSIAENCGNGIRIVAAYLARDGRLSADGVILTGTQRTSVRVIGEGHIEVKMGRAVLTAGDYIYSLQTSAGEIDLFEVSMGNPHVVIQDPDPDARVTILGPEIETHEHFPDRTNVEFVRTDGPSQITMRVWERGVGQTLSCGTGACAAAVSAVKHGHHQSPVTVHLAGGTLVIDVDQELGVTMTGPATFIYAGEVSAALTATLGTR
jgi:diaminopimelate epimerase